jgi:flagellar export protein FliJ
MKAFKFTLQPVRTVRQRREQEAMEAYSRALLDQVQAAEQLRASEAALDAAQAEWQGISRQGCCASEMVKHAAHCHSLEAKRQEKMLRLADAERKANAGLEQMLAARQQREGLDKVLAKQRAAYSRDIARADQKFIDELAQRRGAAKGLSWEQGA